MEKKEIRNLLKSALSDTIEGTLTVIIMYVIVSLVGMFANVPSTSKIKALIGCIFANFCVSLYIKVEKQSIREQHGFEKIKHIASHIIMLSIIMFFFSTMVLYYLF